MQRLGGAWAHTPAESAQLVERQLSEWIRGNGWIRYLYGQWVPAGQATLDGLGTGQPWTL